MSNPPLFRTASACDGLTNQNKASPKYRCVGCLSIPKCSFECAAHRVRRIGPREDAPDAIRLRAADPKSPCAVVFGGDSIRQARIIAALRRLRSCGMPGPEERADDRTLVERATRGDREAF